MNYEGVTMKMNKQRRAKTIMISQVIIGSLCITVVAILILSGTFMAPKYLEPWEKIIHSNLTIHD